MQIFHVIDDAITDSLPTGVQHPCTMLLEALPRVHDQMLVESIELPAIAAAWRHAIANESRELVALDNMILNNPEYTAESSASAELGAGFLKNLLPLRDERVLKRYAAAVMNGAAPGGHLVVFGLMLAVFSVPPRQALLDYTQARLQEADSLRVINIISDMFDRAD